MEVAPLQPIALVAFPDMQNDENFLGRLGGSPTGGPWIIQIWAPPGKLIFHSKIDIGFQGAGTSELCS